MSFDALNITKNHIWCSQVGHYATEQIYFRLASRIKEIGLPSPRGLLELWMWIILKAPQVMDLPLKFCQRSTMPIPTYNKLYHLCSYNVVKKNNTYFMVECPLYDSIRCSFPSIDHNVILGSLKSSSWTTKPTLTLTSLGPRHPWEVDSYHVWLIRAHEKVLLEAIVYILYTRERCYFSLVCNFTKRYWDLEVNVGVQKEALRIRVKLDNRCASSIQFMFSFIVVTW